eukprot:Nitzschia sp. Nitz4//scaffold20_size174350//62996//65293//NITZ4_002094-RA/size174350-processed-gene-0.20-mRNA-1//1//CDS//3329541785//2386//frame0
MMWAWTLLTLLGFASAKYKHTSLEEPFQSEFKNLDHYPCVTLYHRNGRVGCGTVDRETQSGPLFYYDGSSSPPNGRTFVAVIEEYHLSADTMNTLISSNTNGNLKGVLVLNSTYANDENKYSSPGPQYPLGYSTPSADISYGNVQFPWNGNGDGLVQSDLYGIPMAYVDSQEASYYIRQSAQDSNKAVQIYTTFNYYMGPDQAQSFDCLGWHDAHDDKWNPKCLPLGGTSVWGFAGSPPTKTYGRRKLEDAADEKPAILLATSTDSTSMFHDLVPGANEGATNTLTLLMAAYLLGQSVSDSTLDALNRRIVFGFFDGEAYGYLGSRRFINDVLNFECQEEYLVHNVAKDQDSDFACLYPMRPNMRFKDIGEIAGMVTVDQVGNPSGNGNLYVHNDGGGGTGSFLASVLKNAGTDYYTAVASEAGNQNNGGGDYPYPPTPLASLQSLTEGNYGGAVLTGYDYAFTLRPPYQSHMNWVDFMDMNYKAISSAATMLARTALAAAYDDGSNDYETAAEYAANVIPELSYNDDLLLALGNCLLSNGACDLLQNYANMEAKNERKRTGFDIESGESLGKTPNYYVGVYKMDYGQPFVRVGDNYYGAYNGEEYGNNKQDAFGMQPRQLPQAIRGMLHDFLGRGSSVSNLRSCKVQSDCQGVAYCDAEGDVPTCAGHSKVCVCTRAFYHIALDEAIEPAANNATGFFEASDYDAGVSPVWTEPYWSYDVGVKMYRVSKRSFGFVTLAVGGIAVGVCFFVAVLVKVGMKKEKVY